MLDVVSQVNMHQYKVLNSGDNLDVLIIWTELHHELDNKEGSGYPNQFSEVTHLTEKCLHNKSSLVGDVWED